PLKDRIDAKRANDASTSTLEARSVCCRVADQEHTLIGRRLDPTSCRRDTGHTSPSLSSISSFAAVSSTFSASSSSISFSVLFRGRWASVNSRLACWRSSGGVIIVCPEIGAGLERLGSSRSCLADPRQHRFAGEPLRSPALFPPRPDLAGF